MSLISKHKSMCNRLFHLKNLNIGLVKRREITISQKVAAEDKGKGTNINDDTNKPNNEETNKRGNTGALVQTDTTEKPKKKGLIERIQESHERIVMDSSGIFIRPTNKDKVALLWSQKYERREDIPEFIHGSEQIAADNTARVVIFLWIMFTATFYFLTMIKCGQRRTRSIHERITAEQNRIWREREIEAERRMLEKKKPKQNA